MRLLTLIACALALGCVSTQATPDYSAINSSVEQLLRDGVVGEVEVRYIPDNPARGDSYNLSYISCSGDLCELEVDLTVYWMSNYNKMLGISVYSDYDGNVLNYTVFSESTVQR